MRTRNRHLPHNRISCVIFTALAITFVMCACGFGGKGNKEKPGVSVQSASDTSIVVERDLSLTATLEAEDNATLGQPLIEDSTGYVETSEPVETSEHINDADNSDIYSIAGDINNGSTSNVGYAYSMLDPELQSLYTELYDILKNFGDKVEISSKEPPKIDKAFQCVMLDHPEIFYVTGYTLGKYMLGDEIKKIAFSGTYTMDATQAKAKSYDVEAYSKKCIDGLPEGADDFTKIRYVYEYIIRDSDYDLAAPDSQNILSICENHRSVCQGYAKMTQYLLGRMGIFCTLANGTTHDAAGADTAHVWNIVRADGEYYHVDTTWGDSTFVLSMGEEQVMDMPEVNYDYLLVTDADISEQHVMNPVVPMPSCTSLTDNYYVRTGTYFTSVDSQQIKSAFDRAYASGEKYIFVKCADSNVYSAMKDHLIGSEKIFDYISGTSVHYAEYPEKRVLLIYI